MTNPLWSYQAGQHALYKGMIHKRGVLLLQRDVALVFDRVEVADAAAEHRFDCIWHLAPDLDLATVSPGVFTGKNSKGIDVLKIIPLTWESGSDQILKGATSPLQGWVSITYEKEVPAPVLKLSKKTTGGVSFVTLIVGGQSATSSEVTARLIDVSPSRFEVEVKSSRGVSKVILDNFMDADESVQVTP